jgi:hypothetical protein
VEKRVVVVKKEGGALIIIFVMLRVTVKVKQGQIGQSKIPTTKDHQAKTT